MVHDRHGNCPFVNIPTDKGRRFGDRFIKFRIAHSASRAKAIEIARTQPRLIHATITIQISAGHGELVFPTCRHDFDHVPLRVRSVQPLKLLFSSLVAK